MKAKLSFILALGMLVCLALSVPVSATTPIPNLSFISKDKYCMEKPLDEIPSTFEATIYIPENFASAERPGTIIGNYDGTAGCVNIEVHQNGRFRYYAIDQSGKVYDYIFKETDLRTGWSHIAITRNLKEHKLELYINGELAQVVTTAEYDSTLNDIPLVVGGDARAGNGVYFKGKIQNIAMYSDIRTAEEIRADMDAYGKEDLIAAYDFSALPQANYYDDLSGNNNDLKLHETWIDEAPVINDYDYAIAFVPDTQVMTYYYPDTLPGVYDWIVENAAKKNIQFVVGLGDITERSTDTEWLFAKEQITKMNGVVRYSLVRGNHDTVSTFCHYFPYHEMKNMGGCFDYMPTNTWQEIHLGDLDYLIMSLDYGPDDSVLKWAGDVISAHPNHNVIISTHCYLYRDGTTLDEKDTCPPSTSGGTNNGDQMWDKLIKKYDNIVMVVSGHDPSDRIVVTQTQGDNGNIVTQMLIDAQNLDLSQKGVGLVAIAYFSNGGKTVQMEYFSTTKQKWFLTENQFTMEVDVVAPVPAALGDTTGPNWWGINIAVSVLSVVILSSAVIAFVVIQKNRKDKV